MIEILSELQEGDETFTQIMKAVRLSTSNIVARLREAEAYRLINRVAALNEGRVEVKYTLTEKLSILCVRFKCDFETLDVKPDISFQFSV